MTRAERGSNLAITATVHKRNLCIAVRCNAATATESQLLQNIETFENAI